MEEDRKLGLSGWVKNNLDGGVERMAEGDKDSLERLIEWCRQGSSFSKVNNVDVSWEKYTEELGSFEVKL